MTSTGAGWFSAAIFNRKHRHRTPPALPPSHLTQLHLWRRLEPHQSHYHLIMLSPKPSCTFTTAPEAPNAG
uniref:Uncharacterized protein n=1 Tax=Cannabis sativa TaxID=3483 RepID=A0A803PY76_CANSA